MLPRKEDDEGLESPFAYEGNPGLCGLPLSRKCPMLPRKEDDGWKIVAIGYACGLIIGVVLGHIFCTRKHEWFVKIFGMPLKRMERKRGRRRNQGRRYPMAEITCLHLISSI
ncbi:hypothetical protein Q3G72_019229 [Acer saccharum]|nr:hypothetical protein Q3G72_019229 [Acer saccharum]